jgi:uncharacterized membrane protein
MASEGAPAQPLAVKSSIFTIALQLYVAEIFSPKVQVPGVPMGTVTLQFWQFASHCVDILMGPAPQFV